MKTILITGGTGYFGKYLAKFLKDNYKVILGARNNKQNFFAKEITGCQVVPIDVARSDSIKDAVMEFRPDIIIHAAATKFIDLSEIYSMECWDVNIVGSQNVARVAMEFGVETVIGISTDKSVPPIKSSYGLSKAVMERMFCSVNPKSKTKFTCIRFGNIVWSTGSVFRIWKEKGVKLTDPTMRRFFLTIDEAVAVVNFVLEKIDRFQGTVALKKYKSASMGSVADIWIKLYGGQVERIPIRPGERMDEFLIGEIELPYTQAVYPDYYAITFNQKADNPPIELYSTANAPHLTEEELTELIKNETGN